MNRTYIHLLANWTQFFWDLNSVAAALVPVRHRQGLLLGRMSSLAAGAQANASLAVLTDDAVQTSAIEGEVLEPQSVRSSLARNLRLDRAGVDPPARGSERDRAKADAIVTVLLDATQRYDSPLTSERLFGWHAALFPIGFSGMRRIEAGQWRTDRDGPMQVVSGREGRERVPIVLADERVVWVAGLRVAEFARVEPRTRARLRLDLVHPLVADAEL